MKPQEIVEKLNKEKEEVIKEKIKIEKVKDYYCSD